MLISAHGTVNVADNKGPTPLYICVRSLSTKDDLRHQLPCIFVLFRTGADMLNFNEWLLYKGPGIPDEMMVGAVEFRFWYRLQITRPQTLRNLCRKVIQKTCCTVNLRHVSGTMPGREAIVAALRRHVAYSVAPGIIFYSKAARETHQADILHKANQFVLPGMGTTILRVNTLTEFYF